MVAHSEVGSFEWKLKRIREELVAEARLSGDARRYEAGVDDALAAVRRLVWDQLGAEAVNAAPTGSGAR